MSMWVKKPQANESISTQFSEHYSA